jgi:acyl carrier protein
MSLDTSTVQEHLCAFIKDNLVASGVEVNPNTAFDSLGLDSFSLIEIVLFIERKFGIQLPDTDLNKTNLHSAATLSDCVMKHADQS